MRVFSNKKFVALLILVIIVSWFVLDIAQAMYKDQVLIKAVIGVQSVVMLVFIYLLFGSPNSHYAIKFNSSEIDFRNSIKNLVLWVFLSIIIYWSLHFIYDVILYFL